MDATIAGVRVAGAPTGPVPVVLLAPAEGGDPLPVFIGFDEAAAIARGIDADAVERPLTHDLLLDVVEELGGRVDRVVVSDVEDGTYIADLHLDTPRDGVVVDARPSDSLALAARTDVPIEIDADVYEQGRRDAEEFTDMDDIREVIEL